MAGAQPIEPAGSALVERLRAVHLEMMDAVLGGEGLGRVAQLAADAAGAPVAIVVPRLGAATASRGATDDLRPKVKIECVVATGDVQTVVDTILKHARTGSIGDGKVFVLPVDEAYRIRTGESGEETLQAHPGAASGWDWRVLSPDSPVRIR